ncbi:MAG: hypothetical protein NTX79_06375 [Candidatus Micrarchaeota archaeon]|nr:hypothetical protein [Candidatus Micrarchaeota archaeon]
MKGQYFSFDAIIATVIMVLAFSSLVAYWYGAQAVVESRTYDRLADANRIAESLLSPGSPSNWNELQNMDQIRQIGIATSFGNELDMRKVDTLAANANMGNYAEVGNLLRAGGEYCILIEQADDRGGLVREIGRRYDPANATFVAVANRGATLEGHPVRMRVFLWK